MKTNLILLVFAVLIFAVLSHNAYATTLATTTALTSSLNPSTSGGSVTFTATVNPAVPDNETVTFHDGTTVIGTGVTSGSVATLTISSLSVGSHQINATYSGYPNFDPSTSSTLTQTVNRGNTATTLASNTNPSVYGQSVTFTAIVAPVAPSTGTPAASVVFTIDGISHPPVPPSGGQATFTTSTLSAGTHHVTAQFVGGNNFDPSTSSTLTQTVNRYGGFATKCSSLAACSFILSSTAGSGWASTSAFVGGYVGQSPLLFSGGVTSFLLPGETTATYNGSYSGQAILAGYSSTAGTLYHVTGKISGTDANDGTIVTGSTDTFVGIKGHSGRGGGNTYTLVNGSIAFIKSTQRSSATSVACTPSSIIQGNVTTCTATVSDPGAGSASTPTGMVSFTASNTGLGSFSPTSCTLLSGSCSVNFQSNQEYGPGTTSIYASYAGDSLHTSSSGSTLVYVTPGGD